MPCFCSLYVLSDNFYYGICIMWYLLSAIMWQTAFIVCTSILRNILDILCLLMITIMYFKLIYNKLEFLILPASSKVPWYFSLITLSINTFLFHTPFEITSHRQTPPPFRFILSTVPVSPNRQYNKIISNITYAFLHTEYGKKTKKIQSLL